MKAQHPSFAPDTLSVHGGIRDSEFHPLTPPIYQTSSFAFESVDQGAALFAGEGRGFIYSRMGNPTVAALEASLAALEGGAGALACGSGMAAVHTAIAAFAGAGDHVVCSDAVYGPTCTLLENVMVRFGVEATLVDTSDPEAVRAALRPNTRVVYVETPGNPTLVVSPLAELAGIAHDHGAVMIVDNTFCSPILQRPFEHGADVVVHSLTKFLNGHADVVGGAIVCRDDAQVASMRKLLNHFGGVLPPMESFLVHRGIRTLALRMRRHCENAQRIAEWIEARPEVAWVRFPGLPSHPQHEIAKRQQDGPGGLIAFELEGGLEAGKALMNGVELILLAVSLGGVESLIQHPASMTHASMGVEARLRGHITDGLVRLSVGIEDPADLIADLEQAFTKLPS